MRIKRFLPKFTKFEIILWAFSALFIIVSSLFGKTNALNLIASFVGVTALIFVAKGNVIAEESRTKQPLGNEF